MQDKNNIVNWLGYGGLVPFVGLTILGWVDTFSQEIITKLIINYAAIILSFVGALHWGMAMTLSGITPNKRHSLYVWSVVPALIAWACLSLPHSYALGLLIATFLYHLIKDFQLSHSHQALLPSWYLTLRVRLTIVVSISLLTTLLAVSLQS